jgi:terminal uridylyltransferase
VESTGSQSQTITSRYLIAIEDPFELSHNVARTVNHRGLFEIRGEFMRTAKMLNSATKRTQWLSDICIERVLPDRFPPWSKRKENEAAEGLGETVVETVEIGDGEVRVASPPVTTGVDGADTAHAL